MYVVIFVCLRGRPADNGLKGGEIDIIEGVHDNHHNQVAWHASPGKFGLYTALVNLSQQFQGAC